LIIQTESGRHLSKLTTEEEVDNFLDMIKSLTDEERRAVIELVTETSDLFEQGEFGFDSLQEYLAKSKTIREFNTRHYEDKIVDLKTFIYDDYYMGSVTKNLWPKWYESLEELFSGAYQEVILTGSLGSGKTTFGNLILARMFYELLMLKNPQSTFGLMPGKDAILICYNRDKKLAREVTYGALKNLLRESPFFNNIGCKFGSSEIIHEGKHLKIMAASVRSAGALGQDIIGGIIDETEFLQGGVLSRAEGTIMPGEKPFAERLYESTMMRIESRYLQSGIIPGKLVLSSSAKFTESFTNRRLSDAKDDPKVFARDYAIYDVKPADQFKKQKFYVLVGNARIRHKILMDEEYNGMGDAGRKKLRGEGCRFIRVPEDFRKWFERNIEDAIRDIAGIVTTSKSHYIQLRERIYESIDPTLFHPMKQEVWHTGEEPHILWSKLTERVERKLRYGRVDVVEQPIRHPHAVRHVHFDMSLGRVTAAGLAITHIVDTIEIERRDKGSIYIEEAPIIEVDLMLRIEPPANGEIDLGAVRGLVYEFMDHGYTFAFASADAKFSGELLQKLRFKGIPAETLSVDKDMIPYDCLKDAMYEGRLVMYKYPWVINELENLQRNDVKGKVEKLSNKSKDVADALAGSVYTVSSKPSYRTPIMKGISEYDEGNDDEWIRQTMQKKGEQAPKPVSGPTGGGFIGGMG